MAGNHLESLVADWYEFRGYFVRRNVQVAKRSKGGYECELHVVAFHPGQRTLVHIEPSLDSDSWAKREIRYRREFEAGRKHIPQLFPGINIPAHIEQIALFVYGSAANHKTVAGGRVMFAQELMDEIYALIGARKIASSAVPAAADASVRCRTLEASASSD